MDELNICARRMEALERRWFAANRRQNAARAAFVASAGIDSLASGAARGQVIAAQRQKRKIMRRIEALENSLLK